MVKMYDAKSEIAAKQHHVIRLSRKPYTIQRPNLIPKRHNYVLITPTNANTTYILLDWLSPLNYTILVYLRAARL